jgi:hypothetical protein
MDIMENANHLMDRAAVEDSFLHQMLLFIHFIVALVVFGALGSVIRYEVKRMRKLELTRDATNAAAGVRASSERPIAFAPQKKDSRKFAAQYALYRADYFLSTAAFAKPLLLLLMTYIIIILGGFFYAYLSGMPFLEAIWLSWTMVADPGAHSGEFVQFKVTEIILLTLEPKFVV